MKKTWLTGFIVLVCFSYLVSPLFKKSLSEYDINGFSHLPVLHNGRIKPIDSVARHHLVMIQGKQRIKNTSLSPSEWLLLAITKPKKANELKIFRILNPDKDIQTFLGLSKKEGHYVSFSMLKNKLNDLHKQATIIEPIESQLRSPFQRELYSLYQHVIQYTKLKNTFFLEGTTHFSLRLDDYNKTVPNGLLALKKFEKGSPLNNPEQQSLLKFNLYFKQHQLLKESALFTPLPSGEDYHLGSQWTTPGNALLQQLDQKTPMNPALSFYATVFDAYQNQNTSQFNNTVADLNTYHSTLGSQKNNRFERLFNSLAPFYKSLTLYTIGFLLLLFSFLKWKKPLYHASITVIGVAYAIHTFGIISRMIIQWRPPVTNLYSSAIFVGWIAILVAFLLEKRFKNRLGLMVASIIGFLTLIIAHHLSLSSDTLEMMQAVLDTNFWLATHVVIITMGYAGSFLAGFLGIIYILLRTIGKLSKDIEKDLSKMVFGIICFTLLFSFIGTILGGIWADQSWGRFWGWDPKENGALMIVLYNALLLHVRMAGYIKARGLMIMAIFGNIITSYSWFGVNMLGIGLHSYGFMDKAFFWLMAFIVSQLSVIGLGLWPSFRKKR